ncbi:hypothetical protein PROFUN_10940 [Planoprotostelium fungivorum]|uniref:Complex 1 LYR protein domain-containing protein n=1 Tax=Planoprotostelium fungivorum TaxID=1890364 RepID=A0A2P6NC26_9EUKA|nr:hypothetical protein PROFUN_10940 [Planoprotostelium fungivorum]
MNMAEDLLKRSTTQIYRDCLRTARLMSEGNVRKEAALIHTARLQFKKNKHTTDLQQIDTQKSDAIRIMNQYLLYITVGKEQLEQKEKERKEQIKVTTARIINQGG